MKKIQTLIIGFALAFSFGLFPMLQTVSATVINDPLTTICTGENNNSEVCKNGSKNIASIAKQVIDTLMFCIGIVAVAMIIFSGIKYIISMGDAGNIAKAKNTLMYSVIGLVVAFLAYAIVNFVIDQLLK